MRIKNLIILIVFFILAVSCKESFDKKIATHIEQNCTEFKDPYGCTVDLNAITDFDWDTMYVFGGVTMQSEIESVIGFKCNCKPVRDNYMRIVFVNDKEIVYQSQYYGLSGMVQFRTVDEEKDKYIRYSKETAIFYALKKNNTITEGYFFDLYSVKGTREPVYRK